MAKKKRQFISGEELKRKLKTGELHIPTKLLHEELEPEQEALARYTYRHCGRLLYGNYEQWESGFLRERDPDRELMFWLRVAVAVQNIEADDEDKKAIIGECVSGDPPQLAIDLWEELDSDPDLQDRYLRQAMREVDPDFESGQPGTE